MSTSVIDAFKSLNVASAQDRSDHETIFEVSYQYLSKVKDYKDLSSFHNCIVSLINSDKYYRAYQLIKEVPAETHEPFPVEKAYVYYKIGHVAELEAVYHAASNASDVTLRALKHVLAQCYYQQGRIEESLQIYRDLIASNSLDNHLDLACNERAILSSQGASSAEPQIQVAEAQKTYDIVFNEALIQLARGNVPSGLELLEKASQMCLDQNMDSDPSDLLLELAPIKISMAYAHQVSGNADRAVQVMKDIDIAAISDPMIKLIYQNNMASLTPHNENVNFLSRELNLQRNLHHLRQKLTSAQHQVLLKNHLLLSYQGRSLNATSKYLSNEFYRQYSEAVPGDVTPLIYKILVKLGISLEDLNCASKSRMVARKILRFGLAQLDQGPSDTAVAAALLLVHVNSKPCNFDQSIFLLEKLTALESKNEEGGQDLANLHASAFGTLLNLYEIAGVRRRLTDWSKALMSKLESIPTDALRSSPQLYEFAKMMYFRSVTINEASEPLLKNLADANPEDVIVSCALKRDASALGSAHALASKRDVDELLETSVDDLLKQRPQVPAPVEGPPRQGKRRKLDKKRFSKTKVFQADEDFDPETLDPERWLPMKLRSYYKPPKSEKKKSGGLQGAVEPSPAPSTASRASTGGKSKQSKKKKGKK